MVHCPACDAELTDQDAVEPLGMAATTGCFTASKRFYLVACDNCGAAIGSGVAGAM